MFEVIFLIVLGIIWITLAVVQDLKKREVSNWTNFSLIIFALGFRFFWGLFGNSGIVDFSLFYQGLIGLGIFFIMGNLFYYGRIFAGGDAKLMIALGAILPFYGTFRENIYVYAVFLFLFLLSGAIYGLVMSISLAIKSRKAFAKQFKKQYNMHKNKVIALMFLGLFILIFGFSSSIFFLIGIFVFVSSYFYLFAKAVDEACMIKKVSYKGLTEGDWLYKDIKLGRNTIKASWDGLSAKDIEMIKKSRKIVLIRQGIPFTPVFLIGFIALIIVWVFMGGELFELFL